MFLLTAKDQKTGKPKSAMHCIATRGFFIMNGKAIETDRATLLITKLLLGVLVPFSASAG